MRPSATALLDPPRLAEGTATRLLTAAGALAAAGALLSAAALFADPRRFAFAYLAGFAFAATLALGGLFFVMLQHLTRAGWSVGVRRQMEWLASALPVVALLFVPVAALSGRLYPWMDPAAAADELLQKKAAWLNAPFFFARAAVYLALWSGLSWFFTRSSRAQDESGDPAITLRMQAASAPGMVVFGFTVTFAAFDWLMSLDPHWVSTIYGVHVFSGAAVGSLAVLALTTLLLQRAGALKTVVTAEHRHEVAKLLFAFVVFWAYIAFSQYILIWYANLPEETVYYRERWEDGFWRAVSLALVVGHFALPFAMLLSRRGKRAPAVLGVAAGLVLAMHAVDLYWLVMPNLGAHGAGLSWIDLAGFLGPAGALALWVAFRASQDNLYPLGDPRLAEAVTLLDA